MNKKEILEQNYDYYDSGALCCKIYYINKTLHRLDGPAHIEYHKSGTIRERSYYVDGIFLQDFAEYYSLNTDSKKIFEYIKYFPQWIKQIEKIARYNNWLSEKELELLACMDMFQ